MSAPGPTVAEQPLRKAAQRMRWFVQAFEQQVNQTSAETGIAYDIDFALLADVFADWLKAFSAQKPQDDSDKPAYVGFAAGLMLRTLIKKNPVIITSLPEGADTSNPAYFWPEGYLYVAFCLNVRGLVLTTDYDGQQHISAALKDSRTWWSFKENVAEDPGLAIAFLDLFAGDEPEWSMPDLFRSGRMVELADKFYARKRLKPVD